MTRVKALSITPVVETSLEEASTLTDVVRALASDLQVRAKTEKGLLRPDAWKNTRLTEVSGYIKGLEESLRVLVSKRATHLIDLWHAHDQDSVDRYYHAFNADCPYGHHVLYAFGVILRFDLRFAYIDSRGYLCETPCARSEAKAKLLTIQAVTPMNAEITFGDKGSQEYWFNPNPTGSIPQNPLLPEDVVSGFGHGSNPVGVKTRRPCATGHAWCDKPVPRQYGTSLTEPWFDYPVNFPEGVDGTVHNVWSYYHHPGYMGSLTERPIGYPHDPAQWGYDVLPGPWWAPIKMLAEALEKLSTEAPDFRDPLRNAKAREVQESVEKEEQNFMDSFLALASAPTKSNPRLAGHQAKTLPSRTR